MVAFQFVEPEAKSWQLRVESNLSRDSLRGQELATHFNGSAFCQRLWWPKSLPLPRGPVASDGPVMKQLTIIHSPTDSVLLQFVEASHISSLRYFGTVPWCGWTLCCPSWKIMPANPSDFSPHLLKWSRIMNAKIAPIVISITISIHRKKWSLDQLLQVPSPKMVAVLRSAFWQFPASADIGAQQKLRATLQSHT
jgi:hypothetical protein